MCDEYDDERLVALWRALAAAKSGKPVEELEDDERVLPTLLAPPPEASKRVARPSSR
jgi:hypothetical protein